MLFSKLLTINQLGLCILEFIFVALQYYYYKTILTNLFKFKMVTYNNDFVEIKLPGNGV